MKLWLLCFLILFLVAEGLQWLGQFPLLAPDDVAQPWVIMAGLGLAIASNYTPRRTLPNPQSTPDVSPQPPAPPLPLAIPVTPTLTTAASLSSRNQPPTQGKSISFDIPKPQRGHRQG